MQFKFLFSFFFICLITKISSQILPRENEILNYNQLMFDCNGIKNASLYKFILSEDSYDLGKEIFPEKKTQIIFDSTQATLIKNLKFGKAYKWKVEGYDNSNKLIQTTSIHTFSLMFNDYGSEQKFMLKQAYNDKNNYKDGIIWCDLYHCAIDRAGTVVWQFPLINKGLEKGRALRDLHMYPNGNLTFITDTNIYYISKDLEVLWSLKDDTSKVKPHFANYHHSFKRLDNGNFIVLQAKSYFFKPENNDTASTIRFDDDFVVEYNPNGQEVWRWVTSEHFDLSIIKELAKIRKVKGVSIHLNSLSIDETGNYIYLGFRDLSRIVKIERKTKKIIAQYGEKLTPFDTLVSETHLFRRQHDVRILPNNELTVFNNNDVGLQNISSALHLKIPENKNDTLKPIWELKLNFDTLSNGKAIRLGSVEQLPNGNYLICTGENGRILEVTSDKKPVWDFRLYEKITIKDRFIKFPQYKIAFNSSLFPYYFTATKDKNILKLNNEGTESDSYKIELIGAFKTEIIQTQKIEPNKSFVLNLNNYKRCKKIKISSPISETEKIIK